MAFDAPSDAGSLPPGGTFIDDDLNVHEGYIEAIAEIGVTLGCTQDEYCPHKLLSRAQMASLIAKALDLGATSTDYFNDDNGSVHEQNINRLAEAGISFGCRRDNYCPGNSVTRAQMASFLARAFGLPSTSTDYFSDDAQSVHEANINRIAQASITLGCGDRLYCPGNYVPRDQMASFLGRGMKLTENKPPYPVRTLVERFYEYDPERSGAKQYNVEGIYRPRQFAIGIDIDNDYDETLPITATGRYDGWDVFVPDDEWLKSSASQYIHLSLTRPTRVAVVWVAKRDQVPSWLNGWTLSGTVGIDHDVANVYERSFGYGDHWIPGPSADGDSTRNYILLFAEPNSEPTDAPPVPAGDETPQPNELCPVWVHDTYQVQGPDGEMYGTWHPQIDATYWCHFGHEHGSNPALIPGKPKVPYQYVAAKVPQNEPDIGFKETIFQTPQGYWVRFIDHAATSSERRVCAQLHTVYATVYSASGEEMFRMGFKADFGVSKSTADEALINSVDCGYRMEDLVETTSSSKKIRTSSESNDYERWRARETVEAANLGMVFEHRFDIRDPFTFCPGTQCNDVQFHNTGETGTKRTMRVDDFIFDYRLALDTGTFYTNPYGTAIVASNSPNAVQQYIRPGFILDLGIMSEQRCAATDPWFMQYVCNDEISVGRVNISGSLDPAGWDSQLLSAAQTSGLTLAEATLEFRCTIETTLDRRNSHPDPMPTRRPEDILFLVALLPGAMPAVLAGKRSGQVVIASGSRHSPPR